VIIRNNNIENSNLAQRLPADIFVGAGKDDGPYHGYEFSNYPVCSNIVISGNTIKNPQLSAIGIASTNRAVVTNNTIIDPASNARSIWSKAYEEAIFVQNASNIYLDNNQAVNENIAQKGILGVKNSADVHLGCNNNLELRKEGVIVNPTLSCSVTPAPAIAGATSVCVGETTTLTASGGMTYKWSTGATTATVTVSAGIYTVTATNSGGCTTVKTHKISGKTCAFASRVSASDLKNAQVYPNPASEKLFVSLVEATIEKGTSLRLLNQLGQMVRQMEVQDAVPTVELDLQGISNGLYYLEIQTGGAKPVVKKVVVENPK
jgi:Secretion system C-terminal sorting domain